VRAGGARTAVQGSTTLACGPDGWPPTESILVPTARGRWFRRRFVSASPPAAHGAAIPVCPSGTRSALAADGRRGAGERRRSARPDAAGRAGRSWLSRATRFGSARRAFTDEAALLEACKHARPCNSGDERNLKVTLPAISHACDVPRRTADDAAPATGESGRIRVDSHPFAGAGLALGGSSIEARRALHGHSDGRVLSAIADALLGRTGSATSGGFPGRPRDPPGREHRCSRRGRRRGQSHGFTIATVDCTIVAARPTSRAHLPPWRERIAELSGSTRRVTSRPRPATSTGGGRGAAISALAIASVPRPAPMTTRLPRHAAGETRRSSRSSRPRRIYSLRPDVYGPAHIGNFRRSCSPTCSSATPRRGSACDVGA
jgi:2C-methyl-D-erythritol 2,4-cyclodiphosphate synthase